MKYFKDKAIPSTFESLAGFLGSNKPDDVVTGVGRWAYEERLRSGMQLTQAELDSCKIGQLLGKGSFANVFLGLCDNGRYVAIKEVVLADEETEQESIADIEAEIKIMKIVIHPNIVRCYGSTYDQKNKTFRIFMEYISGRTLLELTRGFGGLAPSVVQNYTKQLTTGLAALHEAGICHRDIKPENILIDLTWGLVRLCDFGCSKQMDRLKTGKGNKGCSTVAGSPYFMSPEVISDPVGYDGTQADIWSLGATVIQMLTGSLPWPKSASDMSAIVMIAEAQGPPTLCPSKVEIGSKCFGFIECCCSVDPNSRPSSEELLCHPYIA
eukprot:TRINITY_DN1815_c0_g2_i1.p1 TRINITY_DN1815_c0_g2~~TRINITY_DN1815_c0_g2_i1.p1  ORF type:complete len:345 (+),score=69.27 TRINITY_DN1815_c0_g2_i1:61-1035(+)